MNTFLATLMTLTLMISSLSGCTYRSTKVVFDMRSDGSSSQSLAIKADGSTLTDSTDQAADGTVPLDLGALSGASGTSSLLKKIPSILNFGDQTVPTVPAAPVTPEVPTTPPITDIPDPIVPGGQGVFEEVE